MEKRTDPARIVGMAWYRRDQWDRVRACSSDRNNMAENYDDWESKAKDTEQHLAEAGLDIRRVEIDVDSLIAWAARQSLDINGTTRSHFANRLLARSLGMNVGP